ncbi:hypothetical protein [Denitromonas iodatirespirans]|uniref:Uncharacterized protein n=1 Tax=Denitromonas iodatirespirans TaxID=2795389 RepID=A0A944D7P7_DENI1|nr:hypothetical protein [Denitromonas iodatirespirans]MBT0959841.1 hypothetical protein [Denitromonas iodatirespirans]
MNAALSDTGSRARFGRAELLFADPVPPHPLLDGLAEIGRGEYSVVLDRGDGERVFKLISSPADYFYYTADDRPRGPHFPRVFADMGVIGRASSGHLLHLLDMERLHPLRPGSPAAVAADALADAYWAACQRWVNLGPEMGRMALFDLVQVPPAGVDGSLLDALRALAAFIEAYQVLPDILSDGNLLARGDGTLVFSDPVFLG